MMKGQRGYTLVELLVATAISGLIMSGVGTAIHQIVTVSEYGNDKLTAMHEVQNAAHWFTIDGQKASAAVGGNGLVLTLPDTSSITYTVVGTELRRTAGGSQMTLAQNITGASFSIVDRTIAMTITSSLVGRWNVSQQETYKVLLRPNG